MFLISSCSCLCPIQVLRTFWRCSWSSADRQCSNYIWVIKNYMAHYGAPYIRGLTVYESFEILPGELTLLVPFQYIWVQDPILNVSADGELPLKTVPTAKLYFHHDLAWLLKHHHICINSAERIIEWEQFRIRISYLKSAILEPKITFLNQSLLFQG